MSASPSPDDTATVLVVDDETETADLYAKILADEYEVYTAHGGREALDQLDSTVDVVLLDRRMPELSGDEVLAEMRSRGFDCRVVMVTAVTPDIDAIDLDFDDYLVKPVDAEVLRDAVERMLIRKALDEQLQEALALATKMATLESKLDIDALEDSERYNSLEARFNELRGSIGVVDPGVDPYARLSASKLEALYDFADES